MGPIEWVQQAARNVNDPLSRCCYQGDAQQRATERKATISSSNLARCQTRIARLARLPQPASSSTLKILPTMEVESLPTALVCRPALDFGHDYCQSHAEFIG